MDEATRHLNKRAGERQGIEAQEERHAEKEAMNRAKARK